MQFKITGTKRSSMCEGRTTGDAYAFAEIDGDTCTLLHETTACKDFLNDFAFVENNKTKNFSIYGFPSHYRNYMEGKKHFPIVYQIMDSGTTFEKSRKADELSSAQKKEWNHMDKNWENVQAFLNSIEKYLNFKYKTKVERIEENVWIFHVPLRWMKVHYGISAYTLSIRMSKYNDTKVKDWTELDKNKITNTGLVSNYPKWKAALQHINENGYVEYRDVSKWIENPQGNNSQIHNNGIMNLAQHLGLKAGF